MSRSLSIGAEFAVVGQPDDETLVDRFLAGDRSAFAAMVDRHQAAMLRLAYRLLGWSDEAQEVVQEVFLSALKSMGRFDRRAGLATWLTVITVNKCRTHRRKRWLRLRLARTVTQQIVPVESKATDPGEVELAARVREAVARLPMADREVIVLRYLEEMPIERVASVLNLSSNAVHARLHRARRRLEPLLKSARQEDVREG
jgi:RNA polymerase sigma-70 factor (ECF subfamily)